MSGSWLVEYAQGGWQVYAVSLQTGFPLASTGDPLRYRPAPAADIHVFNRKEQPHNAQ
jgi:hypothetical protein